MLKAQTWILFTSDGNYLGQYSAFAPETAVREYLMLTGEDAAETEMSYKHVNEAVERVTYGSREFFLTCLSH